MEVEAYFANDQARSSLYHLANVALTFAAFA